MNNMTNIKSDTNASLNHFYLEWIVLIDKIIEWMNSILFRMTTDEP